jgi:MarR family transcriptional regulator, 2-MHQ and catechol-resistance regulon repressor
MPTISVAAEQRRSNQPGRLDGDAEALHAALNELVRVYQFRDRDRICCHDVSVTQCYAIEALIRRGPSGLNDLAAELYLEKSTASRVVAALERKGYVTRSPHPGDGRAIVLSVTAAGRRLHDRIRKGLVNEARDLLQDFEPAVRRGAAQLILRLARAAAARSGVAGPACCPPEGCE